MEEIVSMEKSDVQLALVEYRDHPPQDSSFVTRVHDFTPSVSRMREWLQECCAQGGGDEPEAVADGLNDALNLNWREKATKICILISDGMVFLSFSYAKIPKLSIDCSMRIFSFFSRQ